jgi:hypothetical protein
MPDRLTFQARHSSTLAGWMVHACLTTRSGGLRLAASVSRTRRGDAK